MLRNFSEVLQCVKEEKKIFKINIFGSTKDVKKKKIFLFFVILQ